MANAKYVVVGFTLLVGCGEKAREAANPAPLPPIFVYHGLLVNRDLAEVDGSTPADVQAFLGGQAGASVAPAPLPAAGGRRMSQYMRDCEAAGVPLPPPWGDPAWQRRGAVDSARLVVKPDRITEVWTYGGSAGAGCTALVRKLVAPLPDGTIENLGIICQGGKPARACFWDNIDATTGALLKGASVAGMDAADIQDGTSLAEVCTNCHRGDNAFIGHPGTPLDQNSTMVEGSGRYEPVSPQPGWENPPDDLGLPPRDGCSACHSIPKLTVGYCGILRRVLENGTMPPQPYSGWEVPRQRDAQRLTAECLKLGVPITLPAQATAGP